MNAYSIPGMQRHLSKQQVLNVVCNTFKVDPEVVVSKNRHAEYTVPRQTAMMIMVVCFGYTQRAVADFFNKKEHATVINARRVVYNIIETNDPKHANKVRQAISAAYPLYFNNKKIPRCENTRQTARQKSGHSFCAFP